MLNAGAETSLGDTTSTENLDSVRRSLLSGASGEGFEDTDRLEKGRGIGLKWRP